MLENIWAAISLGRRLLSSMSGLRKDAAGFGSGGDRKEPQSPSWDEIERKIGDLESRTKEQATRIRDLEQSLENSLRVSEALADRVGTIFWMALIGGILGVVGFLVSVLLATHIIH